MAITSSREYRAKVVASLSQVKAITKAQRIMYDNGIVKLNSNTLASSLGTVSTVLGLAFVASTPAGVVAGITGIVSSLLPNPKDTLKKMVYNGYWGMGYYEDLLTQNSNYTAVEMYLHFIEYTIDNKTTIRFITDKGYPTRIKTSGGWIVL